jgi:pectate lyase-like protein
MRSMTAAFAFSAFLLSATSFARLPWVAPNQQLSSTQPIQRDWINVKIDFGAVGDGVADDTAAFANAIAAFETSQKAAYVLVPPGTYLVDEVRVVDNLHLVGSGKERSIIKARTPGVGAGIVRRDAGTTIQQVFVENLQLQAFLYGIDARAVYYSEFRSIYLVNCDTGILFGHRVTEPNGGLSINDVFSDVRTRGTLTFNVDVDVSTSGDQVNGCQFHSCVFEGRSGDPAGVNKPLRLRGQGGNGLVGISFHGCTLQDASLNLSQCNGVGWYGGYLENSTIDAASNVGGLTVTGAYFQVGGGVGVRLGTNSGGVIKGVTVGGCTFTSASSGGTGIEIRPDIGADSDGIVILPSHYLGSMITGIRDPAKVAEVTIDSESVAMKGYVSVSNTTARLMAGVVAPNGVVFADVGSLYLRTAGGTPNSTLYVKVAGGGTASGWISK